MQTIWNLQQKYSDKKWDVRIWPPAAQTVKLFPLELSWEKT